MAKVKFSKIIENYNLKNYIPEIDTNKIMITIPDSLIILIKNVYRL